MMLMTAAVAAGDAMQSVMTAEILALFTAGQYWPALALLLVGATHLVRRGFFDAWIERRRAKLEAELATMDPDDVGVQRGYLFVRWGLGHLRAFLPVALAGMAWAICVVLPLDVGATKAAHTALLSAIAAMAGHDVAKAAGAVLRTVGPRPHTPDERRVAEPDSDPVEQPAVEAVTPPCGPVTYAAQGVGRMQPKRCAFCGKLHEHRAVQKNS
jgi:hypothetical protein